MKKFVKLTFAFMLVVLLTGCLGKDKVTKCTLKSDQSASGYKITSEYNVYSSKDEVNKVVTTETVESKNNTILAYFEKQLKSQYKANNDSYGGYKYEITNKDGKVVSKVTIDYSKMQVDEVAGIRYYTKEEIDILIDKKMFLESHIEFYKDTIKYLEEK